MDTMQIWRKLKTGELDAFENAEWWVIAQILNHLGLVETAMSVAQIEAAIRSLNPRASVRWSIEMQEWRNGERVSVVEAYVVENGQKRFAARLAPNPPTTDPLTLVTDCLARA